MTSGTGTDPSRWNSVSALVGADAVGALLSHACITSPRIAPRCAMAETAWQGWQGLKGSCRPISFLEFPKLRKGITALEEAVDSSGGRIAVRAGIAEGLDSFMGRTFADFLDELPMLCEGGAESDRIRNRQVREAVDKAFGLTERTPLPMPQLEGLGNDEVDTVLRQRCAHAVAALAGWRLLAGRPEFPNHDQAVEPLDILLDLCDHGNFPIGRNGVEYIILTA